jgi:hypothetical protein
MNSKLGYLQRLTIGPQLQAGAFYLLGGVSARCRQIVGVCDGVELLPGIRPDIKYSTAIDIANFAIG